MSHTSSMRPHVGIIGGGITGLTAAFYLLRAGVRVTILEARSQPGGLSTYFDFGSFHWDKFYHCILTTDQPLRNLIDDLGLAEEMQWQATQVGFYSDNRLYPMSTTMDFLRFPPLSLWQKFRLGLGILYVSRIRNGRKLESFPIADWLVRVFGRANYEKMWGPLLRCKLGLCREEASAAFIWATITRLYSTRDKNAGQKERLGYVRGGYRTVLGRLVERIEAMGGEIVTNAAVQQIESAPDGSALVRTTTDRFRFNGVIATSPSGSFAAAAHTLAADYKRKLNTIKYLGMVCVVLVLKRRLSPFYVTNLTTDSAPFTGVIEMTNLISLEETNGRHLVYLPKYTAPNDEVFALSDEAVSDLFVGHLRAMYPDLADSEIEKSFVLRERYVQPVPVLNYSDLAPEMETGIANVLLANTTQIVNSTLNNNEMVRIARSAVDRMLNTLPHTVSEAPTAPAPLLSKATHSV